MRGAAAEDPGAAVPDVGVAARLFGGGVVVVEVAAEEAEPAAEGEDVVAVDVGGPPSMTVTVTSGSSVSREAMTDPAVPPPTIT